MENRLKDKVAFITGASAGIGKEVAYPGGNVYCATKAAVHMLTEAMNSDFWYKYQSSYCSPWSCRDRV